MVSTMGARTELRSAPRVREGDDQATFLSRWLRVWVILLTVVVLVVVVYLIIITNTLASINGNLATAERAVTVVLRGGSLAATSMVWVSSMPRMRRVSRHLVPTA